LKSLIKNLWNRELGDDLSFFDQQRIRLLDRLVMVSIIISLGLCLTDLATGIYAQALINVLTICVVFIPVYLFHSHKKYRTARFYFIVFTTVVVTLATLEAYSAERFTDTENILIGFSAISIFLLDKYRKVLIYSTFIVIVLVLKYHKEVMLLEMGIKDYFLLSINYLVLFFAIFFFVEIFRNAVMVELGFSQQLNDELQKGKKEVEATRSMLYNMIDNIPLLLAMIDSDGSFLAMNKSVSTMLGIDERKLVGLKYKDTLPKELLIQFESRLDDGLRGMECDFDEQVEFPTGEKIQLLGQIIPLFNDNGVYGMTIFGTDIGDLKEKEQRLEQLNQTKNKLFSIIAHDLKNPINLLHGLVHLSHDGDMTDEEQSIFIDRIQKNLGSVSHMLENLLTWAKSQLDGYKIQRTIISIKDEFTTVWQVYEEIASNKELEVAADIPDSHEVLMDSNHLNMILRNLLSNAIKFTGNKGSISIKSKKKKGHIVFSIADSGVGMNKQTLEAIQNRQFVHSEYGTDGESGTGLGLSLCMEMLEQNGGSLQVASKEGEGTTFKLVLPSV
jgi:PAS domain S-box-containing protein